MFHARRLLPLALLAVAVPAHAHEIQAGEVARVSVNARGGHANILWVETHGDDDDVDLVAFPGPTRVGDSYDIVDEQGWVGRARVTEVEASSCGSLTYARAHALIVWPGFSRGTRGVVVALGPTRGGRSAARILHGSEGPAGEHPGRLFIDLDGDGVADLARQLTFECGLAGGKSLTCVETWVRDPKGGGAGPNNEDGWRRVMRAEVGPCG